MFFAFNILILSCVTNSRSHRNIVIDTVKNSSVLGFVFHHFLYQLDSMLFYLIGL